MGAGDAEFVAELGADDVLAAVAAGEGKVGRAVTLPAREPGEELGVFVVGVGGGVEDGAELAEVAELEEGLRDRRGGGGGPGRGGGFSGEGGDSQVLVVESETRAGGANGARVPRQRKAPTHSSGLETRTGDYFSEAMSF